MKIPFRQIPLRDTLSLNPDRRLDSDTTVAGTVQQAVHIGAQDVAQSRSYSGALVAVVIVAIVLRLLSALYQGNAVSDLPGIYDQISYDGLARRVIEGYGFTFGEDHWPATRAGEPTAHWSYLYTLYLAGVYGLAGATPVIARLLQAALAGLLHVWLVWRIGNRVFGPSAGLIAAGLSAVYVYFVYYAGALITEPFYMVGALWTFDCLLRLHSALRERDTAAKPTRSGWLWLELGLAIGLTTLLRQVFLLCAPFLFVWLWWAVLRQTPGSEIRERVVSLLRGTLLAGAIIVMLIVPWTMRNYRAFGVFVPLNSNSGFAFFWGNHPIYGTNFVGILPDDGPSYYELIPPELLPLNEAELDRALLREGLQFVFDDPLRYVLLSASRTREYFKFWPSAESGLISNLSRVGSFGVTLPFMVYGLWLAAGLALRTGDSGQQAGILLLAGFCVVYAGIHLLTWALIRYRLPVDAVLVIFAALAVDVLAVRFARWRTVVVRDDNDRVLDPT